ncbi:unnamed protein product [Agarophyton chilense]
MRAHGLFENQKDGEEHFGRREPLRYGFHSDLAMLAWIPLTHCSRDHRSARQLSTSCCEQADHYDRRRCSRRSVLLSAAVAALWLPLRGAEALCGEPDPFFTHFLDWREGFATNGNRQIHYRLIGSKRKENKSKKYPVLYLGDAGTAIASGETLELLGGTDRRILFVDQLGVGESQSLDSQQTYQWSELAADEVSSALLQSDIANKTTRTKIHIVAVGFGIQVADVLLRRSDVERTGYQVASLIAEGWSLPQKTANNLSFDSMQGDRICAVEGADGGNTDLLRMIYGSSNWNPKIALKDIAASIPIMALRMKDWPSLGMLDMSIREQVLDGSGRIAHLAATEQCLEEMKRFFDEVEGNEAK